MRALCLCSLSLIALLGALGAAAPADTGGGAATSGEAPSRQSMAIPALGTNGQLAADNVVLESGKLHATGNVSIRSDEFDIDCDDLVFDEAGHSMTATGDRVQLELENMTAVATHLNYNSESGDMVLERARPADDQPYIIQRGETSTMNAFADTIRISKDENDQSVAHFQGHVQMRTTPNSGQTSASGRRPSAPAIAISIPGLGDNGLLAASQVTYTGADGVLTAGGDVRITSPSLDLSCQDLRYEEKQSRMVATGDEVKIRRSDVDARCTQMTYLTDVGRIVLDRRFPTESQPEIWQQRENGIFHARADQITMTEAEDGRTRVDWTRNVMLENLPYPGAPTGGVANQPQGPGRVRSLDDLPNAQVDPFA
jgi:lipopolysaccharide export system protein LptA